MGTAVVLGLRSRSAQQESHQRKASYQVTPNPEDEPAKKPTTQYSTYVIVII